MYKNLSNTNLFTAFVKYLQFPCANSLLVNLLKGKLCWEDLTRLIQKVPSGNPLSWQPFYILIFIWNISGAPTCLKKSFVLTVAKILWNSLLEKLLIDICYRHWTKGIEQVISQKNKHLLKPFHTGFLNFLKSTQNEAELRKELNQTAEADNLGVKPITEVSQATANTIHKWNNTNTNTQIHKYKFTNTWIQLMTNCQKYPTYAIFQHVNMSAC